jgi:hypothetical protein
VMKPRKGSKKNRQQVTQETKSDSDATLASVWSGNTVMGGSGLSPVVRVGKESGVGPVVLAPNYYMLPPTQQRLLHHISSIAQDIKRERSSNLAIYLKELPMQVWLSIWERWWLIRVTDY